MAGGVGAGLEQLSFSIKYPEEPAPTNIKTAIGHNSLKPLLNKPFNLFMLDVTVEGAEDGLKF